MADEVPDTVIKARRSAEAPDGWDVEGHLEQGGGSRVGVTGTEHPRVAVVAQEDGAVLWRAVVSPRNGREDVVQTLAM